MQEEALVARNATGRLELRKRFRRDLNIEKARDQGVVITAWTVDKEGVYFE
jgi:hypothetical protein